MARDIATSQGIQRIYRYEHSTPPKIKALDQSRELPKPGTLPDMSPSYYTGSPTPTQELLHGLLTSPEIHYTKKSIRTGNLELRLGGKDSATLYKVGTQRRGVKVEIEDMPDILSGTYEFMLSKALAGSQQNNTAEKLRHNLLVSLQKLAPEQAPQPVTEVTMGTVIHGPDGFQWNSGNEIYHEAVRTPTNGDEYALLFLIGSTHFAVNQQGQLIKPQNYINGVHVNMQSVMEAGAALLVLDAKKGKSQETQDVIRFAKNAVIATLGNDFRSIQSKPLQIVK